MGLKLKTDQIQQVVRLPVCLGVTIGSQKTMKVKLLGWQLISHGLDSIQSTLREKTNKQDNLDYKSFFPHNASILIATPNLNQLVGKHNELYSPNLSWKKTKVFCP